MLEFGKPETKIEAARLLDAGRSALDAIFLASPFPHGAGRGDAGDSGGKGGG